MVYMLVPENATRERANKFAVRMIVCLARITYSQRPNGASQEGEAPGIRAQEAALSLSAQEGFLWT